MCIFIGYSLRTREETRVVHTICVMLIRVIEYFCICTKNSILLCVVLKTIVARSSLLQVRERERCLHTYIHSVYDYEYGITSYIECCLNTSHIVPWIIECRLQLHMYLQQIERLNERHLYYKGMLYNECAWISLIFVILLHRLVKKLIK